MDMEANHIQRAVVQQINPPNKNCVEVMDNIVKNNDRLYTFGSIHPFDDNILAKIDNYMKMDIKGWKLNPHIWGVPIDCDESIALLKELAKTKLPIMSCSGIGLPKEMLNSAVPTKQTKKEVMTQHLPKFATVYKGNIIKNLIMDCQSYTKYRPNETTGGIFVSWRRKEELPTGA